MRPCGPRRCAGARDSTVSAPSSIDATLVVEWLRGSAAALARSADHLTQLDSAIGDGDHGLNMRRGFSALDELLEAGPEPAAPGPILRASGKLLIAKVGGASGPLWGSFFRAAGKALGEEPAVAPALFAAALRDGLGAVTELGAAERGDKTMVDALGPAVERVEQGPFDELASLFRAAAEAARLGAHDTVQLQARKGRASYLGERSIGHEDPGAASAAIVIDALARATG